MGNDNAKIPAIVITGTLKVVFEVRIQKNIQFPCVNYKSNIAQKCQHNKHFYGKRRK